MDFLEEHLGKELYNQVAEKLKDNEKVKLANLADGGYVAKGKFEAMETKVTTLQTDLDGRAVDFKELQGKVGDSDTLKTSLDALQVKYDADKERYASDLLLSDVKLSVIEYGANDVKGAMAHLDIEKISRIEGKLTGIREQLDPIKVLFPSNFGGQKLNLESDPVNPQLETPDGVDQWQAKVDDARKKDPSGVTAIAIKQQAFTEGGVVVN